MDGAPRDLDFRRDTILAHLALAIEAGAPLRIEQFFSAPEKKEIAAVFERAGGRNLTALRDDLGGKYEVGELRIFRALAALRNCWRISKEA